MALEQANELSRANEEMEVFFYKEPNNPVDAKAISFMCFMNEKWHKIGCVVKEALDDVHKALSTNAIKEVKFGCVKFRIDFQ